MANYTLAVDVTANLGDFDRAFAQAAARVRSFGADVVYGGQRVATGMHAWSSSVAAAARVHRSEFETAGRATLAFGAAVGLGMSMAVRSAMEWESAWAGVVKTTDATADELPALEAGLRALTEILPASHTEIAAVAEAAGQLGIRSRDVVGFTKVMIDLGEATNLTADEAATSIAQISNIMGTLERDGVEGVERLGAALVRLGNNGASTEEQIVRMALRIAGAGRVIGLTEQEVLAFASALSSLGVQEELGGSAISRLMSMIASSVAQGGADLEGFAQVAGMSAQQFATAFRDTPAEAIQQFIAGLGRISDSGGDVFGTLDDLGIRTIQMRDVLLRTAGGGQVLADALDDANKGWEENTALVQEAARRYETTESKVAIARNQLTELGIEIGSVLLPALAGLAENVADVLKWFSDLPEPVKNIVALLGSAAAIVGVLGGGFLLLVPKIVAAKDAMTVLRTSMAAGTTGAGRFSGALTGLGSAAAKAMIGITVMLGLAQAAKALGDAVNGVEHVDASIEELAVRLADARGPADAYSAALGDLADAGSITASRFGDMQKAVDAVANQNWADEFFGDLGLDADGISDATKRFEELGGALSAMSSADLPRAQAAFKNMWDAAGGTEESGRDLLEIMPAWEAALYAQAEAAGISVNESNILAFATGELTNAQTEAAGAAADLEDATLNQANAAGVSVEMWEEATKALEEQREAWDEAARSFISIGGTYTSMLDEQRIAQEETARQTAAQKGLEGDAWKQFVGDVTVSLDEYLAELQRQEQAQQNWQSNMISLAGKVSEETLDYLARLGPEGAPLVQSLVDGTVEQLAEFDRLTNETMAGATAGWLDELAKAGPFLAQVAADHGTEVAESLRASIAAGETTVAQAAADLGYAIDENIPGEYTVTIDADTGPAIEAVRVLKQKVAGTVIYTQIGAGGQRPGLSYQAQGSILHMAGGGTLTPMAPVAQVVPANTWRVVGDRMDGIPESYIPHDGSTRSHDILAETARLMGYHLLPSAVHIRRFADGDIFGLGTQRAAALAPAGSVTNITLQGIPADQPRAFANALLYAMRRARKGSAYTKGAA